VSVGPRDPEGASANGRDETLLLHRPDPIAVFVRGRELNTDKSELASRGRQCHATNKALVLRVSFSSAHAPLLIADPDARPDEPPAGG